MQQLKILSENDIQKIHDSSLSILEKTGVYYWDNQQALEIFRKNGCRVDGCKVYMPTNVVERCLKTLPNRKDLRLYWLSKKPLSLEQGESHMGLIGNIYYTHDFDSGIIREATNEDLENKDCVLNNLDSFEFNISNVYVLPGHEHKTKPFYNDLENIDNILGFLDTRVKGRHGFRRKEWIPHVLMRPEAYQRLEFLAYAIFEGYTKAAEMYSSATYANTRYPLSFTNPISPLQYKGDQVDGAIYVSKKENSISLICPECMMGGTSPVTLAGTMVQHNAEILGLAVLTQLVRPGAGVMYANVGCVMDMRNADVSHGSFETQLLHVASVQMADYYGMPSRICCGNTSAIKPGPRAAAEAALGLYMGMAAGGNFISTALLNSTLTLSLEHMVLMDEFFKQYKKRYKGFGITDEKLAVDLIHEEGHPSPNYIANDFTIDHMFEDIYYSDFNGRTEKSYEDWYQIAHRKVKGILDARQTLDCQKDSGKLERYGYVVGRLKEKLDNIQKGEENWWEYYCQDFK